MAVVAAHDKGGAGQDVGPVAQRNQGSLGLAQAYLQVAALADLNNPFDATQVVRCRGKFCDHARADVAPQDAGADPLVVVVVPFLASLFPRHVPLRG